MNLRSSYSRFTHNRMEGAHRLPLGLFSGGRYSSLARLSQVQHVHLILLPVSLFLLLVLGTPANLSENDIHGILPRPRSLSIVLRPIELPKANVNGRTRLWKTTTRHHEIDTVGIKSNATRDHPPHLFYLCVI